MPTLPPLQLLCSLARTLASTLFESKQLRVFQRLCLLQIIKILAHWHSQIQQASLDPAPIANLCLDLAATQSFFAEPSEDDDSATSSLDAVKYINRQQKLAQNDLIYCETAVDVLKEAFALLKSMFTTYQTQILAVVEKTPNDFHRMSILKALLQITKLGQGELSEELA